MKLKKGFSLIELIVATFIFAFMMASMVAIYSTITRHMHQGYRQNIWKSRTDIAMRQIQQLLQEATRVDSPGIISASTRLNFAVNVDHLRGQSGLPCYPINTDPSAPKPAWYTVHINPSSCGATGCRLVYCTGLLPAVGANRGCANAAPPTWAPTYPIWCPQETLILDHVVNTPNIFSRASSDGVNENDTVAINLRVHWDPAQISGGGNLTGSQRPFDYSLKSLVKINRVGQ